MSRANSARGLAGGGRDKEQARVSYAKYGAHRNVHRSLANFGSDIVNQKNTKRAAIHRGIRRLDTKIVPIRP
ncbi:MAG: hypothetical protein DU429_06035 [Candidatus Tokpelaia sp.]|nr:MAG: hypothetical protein DU429_06035 [Candidatus Tokpelaia sp.]